MKKTLSMVLAALIALSSAIALGEAPQTLYHEESGITFAVPSGFAAEDISTEDVSALLIVNENDENIAYIYQVAYDESAAGMWLEDLTEEQIAEIAQSIADGYGDIGYAVEEEDGATYLLVMSDDAAFAAVLSLLNGWICSLSAVANEGFELTEQAWVDLYTLQMCIEYDA